MRALVRELRSERGDGLIEGLLVLGLVLLVLAIAVQAILYAHARSIAEGAAQDGARAAAAQSPAAGIARATQILTAAGGTGDQLRAAASSGETTVTVDVGGNPPHVFPLGFAVPKVRARATLPIERYTGQEQAP